MEARKLKLMSNADKNDVYQNRAKHLELIETVHTRLVGSSSQAKTWTVSIATAVFIFLGLSDDPHWLIPGGGGIAVIAFCVMDGQYLYLQRGYIKLFKAVANDETEKPFEMDYQHPSSKFGICSFLFRSSMISYYVFYFVFSLIMLGLALATYYEVLGIVPSTPNQPPQCHSD